MKRDNKDEKKRQQQKQTWTVALSVTGPTHSFKVFILFAASCVKASPNTAGWSGASKRLVGRLGGLRVAG